ncbi:MAG TPA: hypothetical protein VEK15_29165 [Vicinamibacteria bacterium]|nr:hypothetical protein [Vicinamibacteria bacterium]
MIVADASVLIALAKMKRIELLHRMYGKVLMGPLVKAEVLDKGRLISAPGVEQLERAVESGWIEAVRLSPRERRVQQGILSKTRLHGGEAEALALADSRKLHLIVDDKEARALADAMGLSYLGTAAVLLRAFLERHFGFEELEDAVTALSRTIWISPAVVAEILKRAREEEK